MMVSALYAGYPQDAFATVNEVQAVMQSNPVKGQVVDENGDPVIGATVMMKGTSKGAITDLNGNFTLENAAKGTLVISYIGYITEEVQTNGQASVKVVLKEDAKRLDEVVVIGYGTQRKEELTSSVMSVKASEFVHFNEITIHLDKRYYPDSSSGKFIIRTFRHLLPFQQELQVIFHAGNRFSRSRSLLLPSDRH